MSEQLTAGQFFGLFACIFVALALLTIAAAGPRLIRERKARKARKATRAATNGASNGRIWTPTDKEVAQPAAPVLDEMPLSAWLHIVTNEPDRAPHFIVAGESGTGKTTVAQVIAGQRGGFVAIADPKPTRPGARKWGGLPYVSIGASGDYRAIELFFVVVLAEVDRRLTLMRTSTEPFTPLTIICDEWMTLLAKCPSAVKIYEIGNIGRELSMRLILLSISDQVKPLKLDGRGDLRENFRFLRLGDKALAAQDACSQQDRPACLEWRGTDRPISVERLDTLAMRTSASLQPWPKIIQLTDAAILDDMLATLPANGVTHQRNEGALVRDDGPRADAVRIGASVMVRDADTVKSYEQDTDAPAAPAPHEAAVITPDELRRLVEAVKMVGSGESMTAALCKAFETTKGSGNPKWKRARYLWDLSQTEEVEA